VYTSGVKVFSYTSLSPAIQGNFRRKVNHFRAGESYSYRDVLDVIAPSPVCYLSGRKIDLSQPWTYSFDHKHPLSKGGGGTIKNLGLTTREANYAKGDMILEDFLELCKDILENHGYEVKEKQ